MMISGFNGGSKLKEYVLSMTLALLFYLSLISGGIIPLLHEGYEKVFVKLLVLIGLIIFLFSAGGYVRRAGFHIVYALVCAILLSLSMLRSTNFPYALEKFDGVVFGAVVSSVILGIMVVRLGGEKAISKIIHIGLLVLFMTVVYKWQFGFFDRNVRYFLNGPNVFGWLMGMLALMSMHLAVVKKYLLYGAISVLFVGAVIWSGSKGALVALFVSLIFMFLPYVKKIPVLLSAIVAGAFLSAFMRPFINWISFAFPDSRLLALVRIFEGSISDVDKGSVVIRQHLLEDGFGLFMDHPFWGIGLGNFAEHSYLGFFYPHNIHLEVFMECGLFVGLAYVGFVIFSLLKIHRFFQVIAVYFILAGSFSGDMGYLRYSIAFILAGLSLIGVSELIKPKSSVALRRAQ